MSDPKHGDLADDFSPISQIADSRRCHEHNEHAHQCVRISQHDGLCVADTPIGMRFFDPIPEPDTGFIDERIKLMYRDCIVEVIVNGSGEIEDVYVHAPGNEGNSDWSEPDKFERQSEPIISKYDRFRVLTVVTDPATQWPAATYISDNDH